MGQLLGGIQSYRVNWGILHVELIYVYDDYRNQGIATMLLNHVEKSLKTTSAIFPIWIRSIFKLKTST